MGSWGNRFACSTGECISAHVVDSQTRGFYLRYANGAAMVQIGAHSWPVSPMVTATRQLGGLRLHLACS